MIKHAWNGYVKYAFGENELKPISMRGHSPVVFGKTKVGATIVDSLDTLYIVGLKDEFQQARDWVSENLNLDQVGGDLPTVVMAIVCEHVPSAIGEHGSFTVRVQHPLYRRAVE